MNIESSDSLLEFSRRLSFILWISESASHSSSCLLYTSSFSVPFSLSLTLAEEDLSFGVSVAVASSVCWLSVVAVVS